jgi:hypothetical protein
MFASICHCLALIVLQGATVDTGLCANPGMQGQAALQGTQEVSAHVRMNQPEQVVFGSHRGMATEADESARKKGPCRNFAPTAVTCTLQFARRGRPRQSSPVLSASYGCSLVPRSPNARVCVSDGQTLTPAREARSRVSRELRPLSRVQAEVEDAADHP